MFKNFFSKSINIPTLRLTGVIGQAGFMRSGLSLASLDKLINKLFSDKKAPAIALIINSPGGSPTQSSLIAKKIIGLLLLELQVQPLQLCIPCISLVFCV